MAEQLLHDPQVCSPFEKVGGSAVSQPVRTDVGGVWHTLCRHVHDVTDLPWVHAPPPPTEEQRRTAALAGESPPMRQPCGYCCAGGPPEGDDPLLTSFAHDPHDSERKVDVINVSGHEFADADPRGVEQLHDGAVASIHRGIGVGVGVGVIAVGDMSGIEELTGSLGPQDVRQGRLPGRSSQP